MPTPVSFATAAFVLLVAQAPALAQKVDPEFLKARQARIEAMNTGDQAAFDRYTADQFVVVSGSGSVESRTQRVARANRTRTPPGPYLEETITPYGDDTVILTWRQAGPGPDQGGGTRTIEVWAKERGTWKLAIVQSTPIQPSTGQQAQQAPPPARKLVIIDRAGFQTVLGEVPGNIWGPRVSPDGTRLAFTQTGRTRAEDSLYVGPLMNPAGMRRIGLGRNAYWSHDGTRLFFSGAGTEILLWRRVEGDETGEQLVTPARAPESRSPDGRILSYVVSLDDRFSGWTLDLTTRARTEIPSGGAQVLGTNISTDGRWIAYESTTSGRYEVYVRPLGRPGPAVQVTAHGYRPIWSADMREMFFDDGNHQLFALPIRTDPTFAVAGPPVALPIKGFVQAGGRRLYDLLPDGRFVMVFP